MNTEYIRTRPKEVLSLSLSDELWDRLSNSALSFLNADKTTLNTFEQLYDDVIALSREISDFLWIEFLTVAYSLKHFVEFNANPLIIKDRHKLYVLTSNQTAFSISEKRFLDEEEHRALMMNENSEHITLQDFVKMFFEEVSDFHRNKKDLKSLKKSQTFIIDFDPRDVEWLARRGITNKDLLYYNEALLDLKKYVFLTDGKNCSSTVKSALMELQGLKALETLKTANSNH
jgi:hypothetical protein